jgi:hypothetical protein
MKKNLPKGLIKSGVPWEHMRENSPQKYDFRSPVRFLIYTKSKCFFLVAEAPFEITAQYCPLAPAKTAQERLIICQEPKQ